MTIKEAREKKVPALDDELAKDTGEAETLDDLRTKVREKLLEADKQRIKREMTRALVKELVKRNEFPVAPSLIDRYAESIVNRAKQQLMMMGVDVEGVDDAKMRNEMRAEAEEEAAARSWCRPSASAKASRSPTRTCRSASRSWPWRATRARRSCAPSWRRTTASTRSRTRSAKRRRLIC